MFGPAIVEPITKSADSIADALAKRLAAGTTNNEGTDMDLKELEAALAKNSEALATTIVAGLVKALKPAEPAADNKDQKAPVIKFEGDPSNLADVAKHQRALRAALVKWDDPKSVEAYQAALAKEAADEAAAKAAAAGKGNEGKSAELVKAEAELAKAQAELTRIQKGSNQSADDNKDAPVPTGLTKEAVAGFKTGSRMAQAMNGGKKS